MHSCVGYRKLMRKGKTRNHIQEAGDADRLLGREDPLKKKIASHSSILAWRIPWREEPDRLQSMGSQRVRHDLITKQQPPHRAE